MPDPISHTALVTGGVSAVLAFIFDVPAPVVFAAFAGSCFAIALAEASRLLPAIIGVIGGTVASSYITPLAGHFFDGYSLRGVAAVLAFILIYFKSDALAAIKRGIGSLWGTK